MSARSGRRFLLGVAALLLAQAWPAAAFAAHLSPLSAAPVRQGGGLEIVGPSEARPGQNVEIAVRGTNPVNGARASSITVSVDNHVNIAAVSTNAPAEAKVYEPGSRMYSFTTGGNITSSLRVAEVYLTNWPAGRQYELRLTLRADQPYTVRARASFQRPDGSFLLVPGSGPLDQQGAPTQQRAVAVREPSPPTPTPEPPTPTPPPPPTATPEPPTPTSAPPVEKPAEQPAEKPADKPAVPAAPPTSTPPGPAATGPGGVSAATPAPPSSAVPASSDGPSMPLLLAGFGIMALGGAVALLAVWLVTRSRGSQPAPPYPGWNVPPGPTSDQYSPPGPYGAGGPGGTARMPGVSPGQQSGMGYPPYGGSTPYPGAQPPWTPPGGGPTPAGWPGAPGTPQPPTRPITPYPGGRTPGGTPAPWDRPTVQGEGQGGGSQWQPGPSTDFEPPHGVEQPPSGIYGSPSGTGGTPRPPGMPGFDGTPRPPSAPGGGGATPSPAERYVDRTMMGRGGMGSVYRAYDSRLQRWVALKIMHADLGLRPGFLERFIREARVAAMLEHPNIVTVYDIEQVGDSIQMVMSWIEGEDLQRLLEREGALPPNRVAGLLTQMAAALDHAHLRDRPVLHRDIKPSNIMIGPHDRVILTDFGIARLMGDVSLTMTGQMVGTPAFMAPEVIQGAEVDGRADVYALGVVLYQMLTGEAPFRAQTPMAVLHQHMSTPPPAPRSIVPGLPAAVDQVLLRALAKDPNERFQTAGALARAFRAALGLP